MHQTKPPEELLQCYDQNEVPTTGKPQSEVKQIPARWWFAVARVWLVNDAGEILCSRRAETLSGNPGKWQTYFGGHVAEGESILLTAQRELQEEAGISKPLSEFHLIQKDRIDEKKVFFESYAVRFNGQPSDLHFSDQEVMEAKWFSMENYASEKEAHAEQWCNSCTEENQAAIREWLATSQR